MLDFYIIEELKRRDRERQRQERERPRVGIPASEPPRDEERPQSPTTPEGPRSPGRTVRVEL